MKLKEGWMLTDMGGEYVAVPTRESAEHFSGIVRLNETGKDIWEGLSEGLTEEGIVEKLTGLYDVEKDRARAAVARVLEMLKQEGLVEE